MKLKMKRSFTCDRTNILSNNKMVLNPFLWLLIVVTHKPLDVLSTLKISLDLTQKQNNKMINKVYQAHIQTTHLHKIIYIFYKISAIKLCICELQTR